MEDLLEKEDLIKDSLLNHILILIVHSGWMNRNIQINKLNYICSFRKSRNKMTIEDAQFNEIVSSVKNTLQSDGTLNKIKAQLRASVIKVLEPVRKSTSISTRSDIEIQALHVIHECLQYLNADATLDVFLVEMNYTVFILFL